MLRKLLWSTLYAGLAAGAGLAARQAAARIWCLTLGEDPPVRR